MYITVTQHSVRLENVSKRWAASSGYHEPCHGNEKTGDAEYLIELDCKLLINNVAKDEHK